MEKEVVIEMALDLLKKGHSVEIYASGYSMFPVLRPGDKVVVDPIKEIHLITPGNIIVAYRENTFVMHRLIEVRKEGSGEIMYLMQGDCLKSPDFPVPVDQLVGIAVSYFRNKRKRVIVSRTRTKGKFIKNRISLWLWLKLKHILSYFSST
jgi:signal peptidase I